MSLHCVPVLLVPCKHMTAVSCEVMRSYASRRGVGHAASMSSHLGSRASARQVLRRAYSVEADIWSLGVVLYILLSGLPPFWGDTEEDIFRMVLRARARTQRAAAVTQRGGCVVGCTLTLRGRAGCAGAARQQTRDQWQGRQQPLVETTRVR